MSVTWIRVCKFCADSFQSSSNNTQFCSEKCKLSNRAKNACENCGKLTVNDKYCSKSCSAQVINSKFPKRTKKYRPEINCDRCGVLTQNERFCSATCSFGYPAVRRAEKIARWLSGEIDAVTPGGCIPSWARHHLAERSGGSCEQCGWDRPNPYSGLSILQIDHIDGNDRNGAYENFRVLCPTCHAMTPTYCGLNTARSKLKRGPLAQQQSS